jgi:ubiquinone/menaquinone biosynthesis C-methylase UbiE
VAEMIEPGARVLDIGCGTGTLALRCLRRGAHVVGLDSSAFMLKQAEKNATQRGVAGRLTLIKDSVTQLHKHFADDSFDVVTSTMALGEFPAQYLQYIFIQCFRIVKPGGRLIIADEVWPETQVARLLYQLVMAIVWVPQFLLLRRVTYPISDLRGLVQGAGFSIRDSRSWPGSSLQLVVAERVSRPLTWIAGMPDGHQPDDYTF